MRSAIATPASPAAAPDADPAGAWRPQAGRGPRSTATLAVLGTVALLVMATLVALGTWQVQRRTWKLALMERVEQRIHAPAVPAPAPAQWPTVTAAADEYRHVSVTGRFLHQHETLVQAATEFGAGFWVLTPLQTDDGNLVFVNRGFVPPEQRDPASRGDDPGTQPPSASPTTLTGLLRVSEPGGAFLRRNAPDDNRWYSRDVPAIAAAQRLQRVAPYFIDADAVSPPARSPSSSTTSSMPTTAARQWPVAGLTVTRFQNNHAVYAITWYTLALMVAGAAWHLWREERRLRRREPASQVADSQQADRG